jgi:16S rRNA (uracil1498-N3)-methyltransferase
MHRFHIAPPVPVDGTISLDKKEAHHAVSVLRIKAGEIVELLDGQGGVFQGLIASADKSGVNVSVLAKKASLPKTVPVTLAAAVIKPEAMDLLVQKAAELGADAIVPLISERTVVRLSPERWESKTSRWKKIAQEACKQCGRPVPPDVRQALSFSDFCRELSSYGLVLLPTLAVETNDLQSTLAAAGSVRSALVMIGPEGDFSKKEAEQAILSGAKPVSLGPLVLRSETAALFALSVLQFQLKNMQKLD